MELFINSYYLVYIIHTKKSNNKFQTTTATKRIFRHVFFILYDVFDEGAVVMKNIWVWELITDLASGFNKYNSNKLGSNNEATVYKHSKIFSSIKLL